MLERKDAIRVEQVKYRNSTQPIYIFECSICKSEIRSQAGYLKKHSGKCSRCVHKKRPFQAQYRNLIDRAKKDGIEFNLEYEDFLEIAKITECYYCNKKINRSNDRDKKGYRAYNVDRYDNNKGYYKENVVPCCWSCNRTKSNIHHGDMFYKMMEPIRKTNLKKFDDTREKFLEMNCNILFDWQN